MNRRIFLRDSVGASALAFAVSAGLMRPLIAWGRPAQQAFDAPTAEEALAALLGGERPVPSDKIAVRAPDIAENGGSVPIEVLSELPGIRAISIVVPKNPRPLIATFEVGDEFGGFINTRIKMRESSEVVALVQTSSGFFTAKTSVKVTMGGCGG